MIHGYTTIGSTAMKIVLLFAMLAVGGNTVRAQHQQLTALKFSADNQERNVSVEFRNEPLADALHTLARKVNVGISYDTKLVPDKLVTYRAEDAPVYKVLNAILTGTGLYATLSENRKVILIKQKLVLPAVLQETITGTVTDASSGETMPGVNI